jgi:hypothetical protein
MGDVSGLTGKRVKIFFDDTGKVLVKEGKFISDEGNYTIVETHRGREAIPTIHVIRMEVLN